MRSASGTRRSSERQASRAWKSRMATRSIERLIEVAKSLEPVATAVAHPCDESSLAGAIDAAQARA